jgi:glycosyltransferase involved in cell wall biosynthesis
LISVMVAVHNGEAYLGEAIESVLAQTYAPVELVVVDDGSTDRTAEVALGYGDSLRYAHQGRAGSGAARNHAIRLASGGLLAFLDADDRFVPEKLGLQWAAFECDRDLELVYGHTREFLSPDLTEQQRSALRTPAPAPVPLRTPSVMLVTRQALLRVGPFSEVLRVGVTMDWSSRAADLGLRAAMLPSVLMERRLHTGNNGLRERDSRSDYLTVVRAALARRRAQTSAGGEDDATA